MGAKKVSIKNLAVDMDIKTKGLELDVYDGKTHLGDLYVTKTGLTWCKGKTTKAKGIKLPWKKFTKLVEPKRRRRASRKKRPQGATPGAI